MLFRGSGFWVQGSGFWVQGSEVQGSGFESSPSASPPHAGFWVQRFESSPSASPPHAGYSQVADRGAARQIERKGSALDSY